MCRCDNGEPDWLEHCRPVVHCGQKLLCIDGRLALLVGRHQHGTVFSISYVLMPASPKDLPEAFLVESLRCLHPGHDHFRSCDKDNDQTTKFSAVENSSVCI